MYSAPCSFAQRTAGVGYELMKCGIGGRIQLYARVAMHALFRKLGEARRRRTLHGCRKEVLIGNEVRSPPLCRPAQVAQTNMDIMTYEDCSKGN